MTIAISGIAAAQPMIAGPLIGGLIGNSVGQNGNRGGATVAGVIVGGTVGAAMTKNLGCEDRGYAYRTYYDGFNNGRPNTTYRWYNRQNDHNGELRVADYYNDPDGFRCANFNQIVYVYGRPQEARGRACQQPDGTWAIVGCRQFLAKPNSVPEASPLRGRFFSAVG